LEGVQEKKFDRRGLKVRPDLISDQKESKRKVGGSAGNPTVEEGIEERLAFMSKKGEAAEEKKREQNLPIVKKRDQPSEDSRWQGPEKNKYSKRRQPRRRLAKRGLKSPVIR